MFRIKNWAVINEFGNYAKPDMTGTRGIVGNVYGNPKFADGTYVVTSKIQDVKEEFSYKKVYTQNSIYYLFPEEVEDIYKKSFPDAYNKLSMNRGEDNE